MANPRSRKIADRIQVIVATMLDRGGIRDPRLGFVTITDVRVTGDLQHASIFYTVLGTDEERASTEAALASAKGLVRKEIGAGISLRLTPTIEFILDALPDTAASITHLLDEARARDAEIARQQATAAYAGDADPYRNPREEEAAREERAAAERAAERAHAEPADDLGDDQPADDQPADDRLA